MKRIFLLVAVLFTLGTTSAQVLYKISGNGLTKPSYIMGTYHLLPVEYVDNVKYAEEVMQQVEQFCGELDRDAYIEVAKMQQKAQPQNLPEGITIKDIFTHKQFCKINEALKSILNLDLIANPELLQTVGRLEPQVLYSALNMTLLLKDVKVDEKFVPLDQGLIVAGYMMNKPVIGLETAEFQYQLLNRTLSLKEQKRLLLNFVDNMGDVEMMLNIMKRGYEQQSIEVVSQLFKKRKARELLLGTKEMRIEMTDNRDKDWAERMPDIMRNKSTFFYVGILHLAGEPGVLGLLRKQGFTVEPLQ